MTTKDHNTIGIPPLTRLLRVQRISGGWLLWTGTRDYVHGSYLQLNDDGGAYNVTARSGEGDESFPVRPTDKEINDANH